MSNARRRGMMGVASSGGLEVEPLVLFPEEEWGWGALAPENDCHREDMAMEALNGRPFRVMIVYYGKEKIYVSPIYQVPAGEYEGLLWCTVIEEEVYYFILDDTYCFFYDSGYDKESFEEGFGVELADEGWTIVGTKEGEWMAIPESEILYNKMGGGKCLIVSLLPLFGERRAA